MYIINTGIIGPAITAPSPTATLVNISWTQPEFSLPVLQYTVTLTQVTGTMCPTTMDSREITTGGTFVMFTSLRAFTTYEVRVNATNLFNNEVAGTALSNLMFTTLTLGTYNIL